MKQEIELQKTYWASVSGGKDSLYMLAHILHNLDIYPLDGVVHFELEIDYPFIKNVIDYMESECKKYNIPFLRIKPRTSWYDLKEKYQLPHRIGRWCNSEYKLDCKKQLNDIMRQNNKEVVYYIGLCANEEKRIKETGNEIYPLYEMGVFEETIWKWAKNQPLFSDYYKYNKRCGCMYCPCATINELAYLKHYYTDNYIYFMNECLNYEKYIKNKKGLEKWSYWGAPKYDTAYRMERVNNYKLTELERW